MLKKNLDFSQCFSSESAELNLSGCAMWGEEFEKILVPFLKMHPEIKILDLSNIATWDHLTWPGRPINNIGALFTVLPPGLTELYLDGTHLRDEEIVALAEVLPQTIAVFDLGITKIGGEGIRVLAAKLSPNLTKLKCGRSQQSCNYVDVEDIKVLANALDKALDLTELTLTGFTVVLPLAAKAIRDALDNKSKLAKLDLSRNDMKKGVRAIAKAIVDKQNLTALNLESNNLDYVGIKKIAKALDNKPNLTMLHLGCNWISATGAQRIARALIKMPNLVSLDLHGNTMSDAGTEAICRSIVDKSNLQHLNLAENHISHTGAKEICEVFADQPDLINLDLQMNNMSDEGIETTCKPHKNKPNFSELDVSHNEIFDVGVIALSKAISHMQNLSKLNVSSTCISSAGAVAISKAISDKQNLSKLMFRQNKIDDEGAKAICEVLFDKEKIEEFDCRENPISDRGVEMLASVLATHSSFLLKREERLRYCVLDQGLLFAESSGIFNWALKKRCDSLFEEADLIKRANFLREKQQVDQQKTSVSTEQLSDLSSAQSGSSAAEVNKKMLFPTPVPSLRDITIFAIQSVLKKEPHASLSPAEENLRAKLLPTQEELQGLQLFEQNRVREAKLRAVLPGDALLKAFRLNM